MTETNYSYKLPETGFKPAPAGIHQGKVFQVLFLGWQSGGARGFKPSRKLALNFLLADGSTIVGKWNPSSHKLSKFPDVAAALLPGKINSGTDIDQLDIGSLLGTVGTLQVKHKVNPNNNRTIAEIGTVLPAMGIDGAKIVPQDFAFLYPGAAPEVEAVELPKFPPFLQKAYLARLTDAQYAAEMSAWKIANPGVKEEAEKALA
jgi:hypothetical protein